VGPNWAEAEYQGMLERRVDRKDLLKVQSGTVELALISFKLKGKNGIGW